jgi:23S rRNA (cytidine1920-2'-O)/16S rRNA (cytidine1409-2'-O)-methyltransferase
MGLAPFASRGGLKLAHALAEFRLDVRGLACADFGCNVGGFTDCLLRAGAAGVVAVDTGYGTLAWTLRNDPRVTVMERTNALHALPPAGPVDLVTVDLAWTPQRHAIPAALRWLRPSGRIISLVKPHYEVEKDEKPLLVRGVLAETDAERIVRRTVESLPALGVRVEGLTRSPIAGGAGKGKAGNAEWLALIARA